MGKKLTNDGTAQASTRVFAASLEDEGIFSAITEIIPEVVEILGLLLLKSSPEETVGNKEYLLKEDTFGLDDHLAALTLGLEEHLPKETGSLEESQPKMNEDMKEHQPQKANVPQPAAIAAAG